VGEVFSDPCGVDGAGFWIDDTVFLEGSVDFCGNSFGLFKDG
jgi:hypothetical protein